MNSSCLGTLPYYYLHKLHAHNGFPTPEEVLYIGLVQVFFIYPEEKFSALCKIKAVQNG